MAVTKFDIEICAKCFRNQGVFIPYTNKAFVGLGSCDNVQTKRSIFKYANWLRLKYRELVHPAGLSNSPVKLIRLADPYS